MKKLLIGLLLIFFTLSPSHADYIITLDPGGNVGDFFEKYTTFRNNGVKIIIDGPCISACTLVLGLIDNNKVCVTSRAVFGFHSASQRGDFSKDGTGLLWYQYPKAVREWLIAQGWDGTTEHSDLIWMDNDTIRKFYMPCPSTEAL